MIKLNTLVLPDDLEWPDEFSHEPAGQTITPTLTGALVVEEQLKPAGRPITLRSNGGAWASRTQVQALADLNRQSSVMTLQIYNQHFQVIWRREDTSFEAVPVMRQAEPGQHSFYFITLRLLEVS